MPPTNIPRFLLPRGAPSTRTLLALSRQTNRSTPSSPRCASSSSHADNGKHRVLEKPDKFRPPSHPARRVVQTRNGKVINSAPINYPGPRLSEKEKEEQKNRQYPNMFPPEDQPEELFANRNETLKSVLTTLATFTFTTNFKRTSPFAHLLPSWSGLVSHPIDTISQAMTVFRMHVEHNSLETRQKRQRRVEDAEKRRQYRVAHGLEEQSEEDKKTSVDIEVVDDQSPVAVEHQDKADGDGYFLDWEGKKRPVKKWLGIW
ncbi:hypothetical protein EYZ11_010244 [Aspergillus tanneri]|uniref:Uncharacterized protein n=1 Tax=Aspergillus tanneri TaxID=1220188 RepID=A0A4S3J5V2_9EURO|nr:hypothetical protein EYZ11_010244 [Aspergillus tanneri]